MSARQIIPQTHDPCALCHKPNATKRCGRCRAVVYCSRDCQAAHWKSAHKLTCGASPPPVPPRPQTPGISELLLRESLKVEPLAALSRAAAGLRNDTLIVNLPGRPKAVRENLRVLLPILPHALLQLATV